MPVVILLSILLLLIILQSFIYKRFALKHLSANVSFSTPVATCGDIITITETIVNKKALPLPWVTLKFEASRGLQFLDMTNTFLTDNYYRADLLSLSGWQQHNRNIRVRCSRRGYFSFKRLGVSTKDLMLLTSIVAVFPCDSTITVVPQQMVAPEIDILFRFFCGEAVNRRSPVHDPFSFAGIREYQPHDNLKSINWNATAKKNELMVNTMNHTFQREMTILLNLMPFTQMQNYSLLEKGISLAVTWAGRAFQESIPVRLISNSRDIITNGPIETEYGCSLDHFSRISIELARIDLTKKVPAFLSVLEKTFREQRQNTTYVIISANADPSLQKFLIDKYNAGLPVVWIIPYDSVTRMPRVDAAVLPFARTLEVAYDA